MHMATETKTEATIPPATVSEGNTTTEYTVTQSGNFWSTIGLVLGTLVTVGSAVVPMAPGDSKWGMIGGMVLAIVSQIYDALIKLGYLKARTDLKIAALQMDASQIKAAGIEARKP
jgi:hypothetical protein